MILSLDIATKNTGYAIFGKDGLVTSGVVTSKGKDHIERGKEIAESLNTIAQAYGVQEIVVEDLKVLNNQKVLVMLAMVHGIILGRLGLKAHYFSPTVWRAWHNHGLNAKRDLAKTRAIQLTHALYGKKVSDDEAEAILLGKFFTEK